MSLVGFKAKNHPQQRANPAVDDRGTDPALFAMLTKRFGFTVDACAVAHNAKMARYWTPDDDGLQQSWAGERIWCNPPYSNIRAWVAKAHREREAMVVMLLPANRTEQQWWQAFVEPFRDKPGSRLTVEFLPGRPRFVNVGKPGIGPNERPPFGCCLLIWEAIRDR